MNLTAFRALGRSGLIVSPISLGTMTFGTPGGGATDEVSESIFHAYVDAGGNFIDTADVYAKGRSEELIGGYVRDRKLRDQLVLATKFSFHGGEPGNPNAGGNGRKNMYRAIEGSLRQLQTDYIDLYWMHVWDSVTPVEEVLQSLGESRPIGQNPLLWLLGSARLVRHQSRYTRFGTLHSCTDRLTA